MGSFLLVVIGIVLSYQLYCYFYFRGEAFTAAKESIKSYIHNCNGLNRHIDDLKSSYVDVRKIDHGDADLVDDSVYNMRRRRWAEIGQDIKVHNCSSSVVKNASDQPFKYVCKYFNVKTDDKTLSQFEYVLNSFAAAEQGRALLVKERDEVLEGIRSSLSRLVMAFSRKRVIRELGFQDIDLSDLHFPVYTFQYVSAGGNSSSKCSVQFNVENLDRFVTYLNELVKFRKSAIGQRALITSKLREIIKQRDKFTCQICDLSTRDERNLLLEIDHIMPISKGGMTSLENLQTLCWKCNRTKGAKLESPKISPQLSVHAARQSGQQALH